MIISRRSLLSMASAFSVAATVTTPSFVYAASGSGAGKANFQDLSISLFPKGDGAPKPIKVKLRDKEIDVLAWAWGKGSYREFSEIIISSLRGAGGEDRLTENLSLNLRTVENALKKANKGKGLVEGRNNVRVQFENPKWDVAIQIVI